MTPPETGSGSSTPRRAADLLCLTLSELGAQDVFGLPGTQNLELTEALRRSDLRFTVPPQELSAAFMANGYYRSSGRPGVVTTIPGPGFTFALTGLAEARLDSAAVLHLTGAHPGSPTAGGRLQEIPQADMARPIVKEVVRISDVGELSGEVARAYRATTRGEPGPVLVEIEDPVWAQTRPWKPAQGEPATADADDRGSDPASVRAVAERLAESDRPLLFAGQGCQDASGALQELCASLDAPVLISTSGRGVLPDDHPCAVPLDRLASAYESAQRLADAADLVLVLGSKLGHNATLGFRLELPEEKVVQVDASRRVMGEGGRPRSRRIVADVPSFLRALLAHRDAWTAARERWSSPSGRQARDRIRPATVAPSDPTPGSDGTMVDLFGALRRAMPEPGCLVTDSGLHQMLARRYFRVDAPRSFLTPTNFQSMGYGIPAALGAALAEPGRPVVALVGDGGLRLSAFDLATARDEAVNLTVLVLVDGYFGLIRRGQLHAYGSTSGVDLPELRLSSLAEALGVRHHTLEGDPADVFERCIRREGVDLVEVTLAEPFRVGVRSAKARLREAVRRGLGPAGTDLVRDLRDRLSGGETPKDDDG